MARVAAELHVHPQTVRYRLARLRERLGSALDDPAARFELALALRSPVSSAGEPGNCSTSDRKREPMNETATASGDIMAADNADQRRAVIALLHEALAGWRSRR